MARHTITPVIVYLALLAPVCGQNAHNDNRTVIIQGAMPSETERLVSQLNNVSLEQVGGWKFWRGNLDGYPVVVSRTLKGVANAAAATAIAIERFHPIAIINQGTAGGLDTSLHLYDIVIGTASVNLGAFKTPYKQTGGGSNSLEWKPMNLMASETSAGNDPIRRTAARFQGDSLLLAMARQMAPQYTRGHVVDGVIGTSDMWNDEIDRIARMHTEFGASVEEMETASAAQVASLFGVPFLGIRVVSDNTTTHEVYESKTGEACEEYVYLVVKAYLKTRAR